LHAANASRNAFHEQRAPAGSAEIADIQHQILLRFGQFCPGVGGHGDTPCGNEQQRQRNQA
jgi:hypothetical protein